MEDAAAVRKECGVGQGGHPEKRQGFAVPLPGREDKIMHPWSFLDDQSGWLVSPEKVTRRIFSTWEKSGSVVSI